MSHSRPMAHLLRQVYATPARRCLHSNRAVGAHQLSLRTPLARSQPFKLNPIARSIQCRNISFTRGPFSARNLMRNHPFAFPVALFGVVVGAAGFVYASYLYWRMYQLMGNYPEKVGLKLRRGIYFTDISEDYAQATKAFVQALQFAAQEGMQPLSDEVIGIKMELVRCLEKAGNAKNAVEICENLRNECLAVVERCDKEKGEDEGNVRAKQRNRSLGWACKVGTRLADLYADPHVADARKSEESLVWAVETSLRERQRRVKDGVKEGEGEWLTEDEIGSQLEALGHNYEAQNKHFFAAQLFLQALTLKPKTDCHSVILMNNLAASLAQQIPPTEAGVPPPSRAELRESGRTWARQALTLAGNIKPPDRTPECDEGCVAATHNLGEFAEMDGNIAEARSRYEEAGSLAHAIGFEDGVKAADDGLRRVNGGRKSVKNTGKKWF